MSSPHTAIIFLFLLMGVAYIISIYAVVRANNAMQKATEAAVFSAADVTSLSSLIANTRINPDGLLAAVGFTDAFVPPGTLESSSATVPFRVSNGVLQTGSASSDEFVTESSEGGTVSLTGAGLFVSSEQTSTNILSEGIFMANRENPVLSFDNNRLVIDSGVRIVGANPTTSPAVPGQAIVCTATDGSARWSNINSKENGVLVSEPITAALGGSATSPFFINLNTGTKNVVGAPAFVSSATGGAIVGLRLNTGSVDFVLSDPTWVSGKVYSITFTLVFST